MPTEIEVIDQIADYCEWLEVELGAAMHRSNVVATTSRSLGTSRVRGDELISLAPEDRDRGRRSRLVFSIAAAVLVLVSLTAVFELRHDKQQTTVVEPPVDSVTADSVASTTTAETISNEIVTYAPMDLPANLVVWDVSWGRDGGTYGAPFTEQLFGKYDTANTTVETGLLVRIQHSVDSVLPSDTNQRVTVRGAQGWVFNPDSTCCDVSIEWVESGQQVSAQGRGMTLDAAVAMLDAMQWRADDSGSFQPSTSTLPLISEEASGTEFGGDETTFSISDPDGPAPVTGPRSTSVDSAVATDIVMVQVGATVLGTLHPELLFSGERRADGSVVSGGIVVEPDGSIVRVLGGDESATTTSIVAALRPVSGVDLANLVDAANERVLRLPEVGAAEFVGSRVVFRGGTTDWPLAICLAIDQVERCRSTAGLHQFASWQNSVLIGGQWFLVGRQPATDPSPIVYPWTPGMSSPFPAGTVIEPTGSQIVGDQLLWYAAIPAPIHAVGVGHLEGNTVVITSQHPIPTWPNGPAFRRPDA